MTGMFAKIVKNFILSIKVAMPFATHLLAADLALVADGIGLHTDNIKGSRFYAAFDAKAATPRFLQVMEIHNYNPGASATVFAAKANAGKLNPDFLRHMQALIGFSATDELYFLMQSPGDLLRPHHVLYPVDASVSKAPTSARFNAQIIVRSIEPVINVAIPAIGDVNIHPSSAVDSELILSPNNLPIMVSGQPIAQFVANNGSVIFFTKVTGNGRTVFSMHYVMDGVDMTKVCEAVHQRPKAVDDFFKSLDPSGICLDPLMIYFKDAIEGRNPKAVELKTYFPAGFDFRGYVNRLITEGEAFVSRISSRERAELRSKLLNVSLVKPDETIEQSLAFLDKLVATRSSFLPEQLLLPTIESLVPNLQSWVTGIINDASLSSDEKIKRLYYYPQYFERLRLRVPFDAGIRAPLADYKKQLEDFIEKFFVNIDKDIADVDKKIREYNWHKSLLRTDGSVPYKSVDEFFGGTDGSGLLDGIARCLHYKDFVEFINARDKSKLSSGQLDRYQRLSRVPGQCDGLIAGLQEIAKLLGYR